MLKGFNKLLVAIAAILLLVAIYFIYQPELPGIPRGGDQDSWQVYIDQRYAFQVEIPPEREVWRLPDDSAGVVFRHPEAAQLDSFGPVYNNDIFVRGIPNPNNLSIPDLFDTFSDSSRFWFDNYTYMPIVVNGNDGYFFSDLVEGNPDSPTRRIRTVVLVAMPGRVVVVEEVQSPAYPQSPDAPNWEQVWQSINVMRDIDA